MAELSDAVLDQRLRERAAGRGGALAFLQRRHGVWQRWTWDHVNADVDRLASGLRAAGLANGAVVGIVSNPRIEAVLMLLACQRAGLLPVLLSPNLAPGGLATLAQQAGVVALLAEDQEQVDKVADMQSRLEGLRALWVIDAKGTRAYAHVAVTDYRALLSTPPAAPVAPIAPEGPACAALALFSAGVFADPRLVTLSHAAIAQQAASCEPLGWVEGERCVSLFGLADPLGCYFVLLAPVLFGSVACFGEQGLPSVAEMRQCAPQVLAIPARWLDRLRRETAARANRSGGWRAGLIQRWHDAAQPGPWLRALVGRPVANGLGLGACRTVMTGYERLSPASARFLARLGIAGQGLYALAEAAGPVAVFEPADQPALRLFDGIEPVLDGQRHLGLRIDGPLIETGDLMHQAGDALHLVGRSADLLTLADGQALAPSVVEAELMASPYVNQAVVVGGPASGLTALIELDEVTLRDWARAHGLAYTTLRSFAESAEVLQLIEQAVADANQRLAAALPAARIVRSVLLPRALEPANGELTPSLALRRGNVRNRYAHRLVGALPRGAFS